MKSSSRNFDALRRLLVLKRHEVPPPGYFHGFSSQVISRIQTGERGEPESLIARWLENISWLQQLRNVLETRPAFAGAFGAGACALLISGIFFSENGIQSGLTTTPVIAGEAIRSFDNSAPMAVNNSLEGVQVVSSTNATAPVASIFDQIQLPTTRASYYTIPAGH